ncbi:MAG: HAD hydrolase family protein, partial [Bacillota bacterium]|nr:HAD hydrolase family protein [Bacillota bacterium]
MDCTLLNSVHKISRENRRAIEYFMSEGGRFAFASGRAPKNLVRFFDDIT